MTPSGGQHDAARCWLGPGSNDPLGCGSSSAHTTFAMLNLLLFAKIPQGMHDVALRLQSSATPRSTLQTMRRLPYCGLVPRLGGMGHQNLLQVTHFREAAFAASCAQGRLTVVA